MFGINNKSNKLPNIILTQFHRYELLKFKYNKDTVTTENVIEFIDDYRNKRVLPFYMSEELEEENLNYE